MAATGGGEFGWWGHAVAVMGGDGRRRGQSFSARVRKAAIWPLVTGFWGQKRVPSGLQPRVIPALAMAAAVVAEDAVCGVGESVLGGRGWQF